MPGEVLLATTTPAGLVELAVDGKLVTDSWNELADQLTSHLDVAAVAFFARPVPRVDSGEPTKAIGWFSPAEGTAVNYLALDDQARLEADEKLTTILLRFAPLLASQQMGLLLKASLQIPSMANVFVVDGNPVITGWGSVPKLVAVTPAGFEAHFNANLGRFMSAPVPPASVGGKAHAPSQATSVRSGPEPQRRWLVPAIAVTVALAVLAVLSFPGVLLYAGAKSHSLDHSPAITAEVERSLEEQIADLKRRLAEPPRCTPSLPRGRPQEGKTSPSPREASGPTPATLGETRPTDHTPPLRQDTPSEQQASTDEPRPSLATSGGDRPLSTSDLLLLADQATAFVIAPSRQGDKVSIGSAFFVNNRHLVTNRHVVESGNPNRISIMNSTIGRLDAKVLVATTASTAGGDDFAILETATPVQVKALALSFRAQRLEPVVAAGYPQMVLETDQAYQDLMRQGSTNAMPQMSVSQGIVTAQQQSSSGTDLLVHSATISPGNSGGPLLDACGRAVGVNTFGRTNTSLALTVYFALGAQSLASFLKSSGIDFSEQSDLCKTTQPEPPAAAAPTGGPTAAPGSRR